MHIPIEAPAGTDPDPKSLPWVSILTCVVCIGIFLSLAIRKEPPTPELLERYGCAPAPAVWEGAVWGLICPVFVHTEWWHVAINVFWLWVLGTRVERAIGSWWYLAFVLASGFITAALQLGVSGDTGLGSSGVCFALFGFMLAARHREPKFQAILDWRTILLFAIWLIGCIVVSVTGLLPIGNTAHIGGLLFGAAVSACWFVRYKPRLTLAAVLLLVGFSIVSFFWAPWSVTRLRHEAIKALIAEDFQKAVELFTHIIQLDPNDYVDYLNRGRAYEELGKEDQAEADFQKAQDLGAPREGPR